MQQLVAGADGGGCATPVDDDCGEGPVAVDGVAAPVACMPNCLPLSTCGGGQQPALPSVDEAIHAGTGLCPLTNTRRRLLVVNAYIGMLTGIRETWLSETLWGSQLV